MLTLKHTATFQLCPIYLIFSAFLGYNHSSIYIFERLIDFEIVGLSQFSNTQKVPSLQPRGNTTLTSCRGVTNYHTPTTGPHPMPAFFASSMCMFMIKEVSWEWT